MKPDYWEYDLGNVGFVLLDRFGFTIVSAGIQYDSLPVGIAEVDSYGFNEKMLIAIIIDSAQVSHLVKCQPNNDDVILISVKDIDYAQEYMQAGLTWINVRNSSTRNYRLGRSMSVIAVILLGLTLLFTNLKNFNRS
jgi:hypothetical protein